MATLGIDASLIFLIMSDSKVLLVPGKSFKELLADLFRDPREEKIF